MNSTPVVYAVVVHAVVEEVLVPQVFHHPPTNNPSQQFIRGFYMFCRTKGNLSAVRGVSCMSFRPCLDLERCCNVKV